MVFEKRLEKSEGVRYVDTCGEPSREEGASRKTSNTFREVGVTRGGAWEKKTRPEW